ncbi:MAG: histidine phosphatase family protein [Ktedonobacteraceae bacterium]
MNTNDPFLLRRTNAAELFLIRHGDALPDADEIIPSGVYDNLPLSKTGREQARALAERLKETHFDAVYSSPLLRCQQTAAPLLEYLKLPLTIVEGIKEVRLGNVSPLPTVKEGEDRTALSKALQERQVEIVRRVATDGSWDSIPDSESSAAFRKRVITGIDEIASKHIGERVLVFAHGGTINAYASEAIGLQRDFFFPCANTSITMLHVNGSQRVVFVLNDVAHLKLQ